MKPRQSGLSARALSLLIAPLAIFPGIASSASHSKKQTKEVYAATDSSEMQPGFAMPVEAETGANLEVTPAPAPKKAKTRATASAVSAPIIDTAPAIPTAKPVAPVAVKSAPQSFDAVPASQKDAILERLTIVENLVRKYGRAYDYRTHTLKELQLIQSTLESTTAPAAAQPAAPQAAAIQPAAAPARVQSRVVAAPAPAAAPVAPSSEVSADSVESNDVIKTGQAAAVENAEDTNLKTLPVPADFGSQADADQEN